MKKSSPKASKAKHTTPGWQESVRGIVAVPWAAVPDVSKETRAFNRQAINTDMRCREQELEFISN